MYLRPWPGGVGDAGADLDCLYRVDRHEGLGNAAIELFGPRGVRTDAGYDAVGDDLEYAAESIATSFAASIAAIICCCVTLSAAI